MLLGTIMNRVRKLLRRNLDLSLESSFLGAMVKTMEIQETLPFRINYARKETGTQLYMTQ